VLICSSLYSQSRKNQETLINSYLEKAFETIYIQKDSTYIHLEKALIVANELEDYDLQLNILDYIITTADYHQDLPKSRKTLELENTILSMKDIEFKIENIDYWKTSYTTWLVFK